MKTATNILDGVQRIVEALIGIILGSMIAVVAAQTFFRFVLSAALPWSEELSRFMFITMIALGINIAISRNMMVRIDAIDGKLSPMGKKIMEVFRQAIGITINLAFAYSTVDLVEIGSRQDSPALGLPMGVMYAVLMLGFGLAVVASLIRMARVITGAEVPE